jgi:hypothetical protein
LCREYYKAIAVTQPVILESATAGAPGKPEYGGRPVIILRYRFQTGDEGQTWTAFKKKLRDKLARLSVHRRVQREHNDKCSYCAQYVPVDPLLVRFVTDDYSGELIDVAVVKQSRKIEEIGF